MSRSNALLPSYRHHKPSGQAVVTLNGRDIYLGAWNSPQSRAEYDRQISEWLAAGRQLSLARPTELTISEMLVRYWAFAKLHYRKHGQPSEELNNIRYALRPLRRLYGHTPVSGFGPKSRRSKANDCR